MYAIRSYYDLPIVPYTWFYDNEYLNETDEMTKKIKKLGLPVIVKPATLGSSVGITVVKDIKNLDDAIMDAITYDNKVVVDRITSYNVCYTKLLRCR